jgi:hypothetical protein
VQDRQEGHPVKIKPVDKELSKAYPEEIALIRRTAPKVVDFLDLENWKIDVSILEAAEKDEDKPTGSCEASPEYLTADIDYYVATMNKYEDDVEQLDTIVHEFLHIYLAPYMAPIRKLLDEKQVALSEYFEESLVTSLAGNKRLWPGLLA